MLSYNANFVQESWVTKIMAQVLEHMNILPDAQPLNVVSSVKG